MSRKSHGKGIAILFLIALITLLGCPGTTGSLPGSDDPDSPAGPGPSNPLNPGGDKGKAGNESGATALATELNTMGSFVTASGSTVKVNDNTHLEVVKSLVSSSILPLPRAAGDSVQEPGQVAQFTLQPGVIFSVPPTASVTIASGTIEVKAETETVRPAEIQVAGSIVVKSTEEEGAIVAAGPITLTGSGSLALSETATVKVTDKGTINVSSRTATVEVPTGTKIEVETGGSIAVSGTVKAAGEIAVAANATVSVPSGGKIAVADKGKITVAEDATVTIPSGGTIEVALGGKVENSGTITATGTVDVKSGGAVEVKSGGSLEVNHTDALKVENSGDVKIAQGADIVVNADISTVADKIAVEDSSSVKGNNTEGKAALALTLVSQTVSYSSTTLSIAFEFSDVLTPPVPTVTEDSSTTWTLVLSNENKTVTATYSGSSGPVTLGFTAVSNADSNKTVAVSTSAYAVESSAFSRSAATYQVVYYGEVAGSGSTTYAIAGLTNANSTKYYLLPTNDSGYFKNLFSAIYTPNAPGSTDSIEASKKAIAYDATVSAAALSLFHVTLDGSESSKDKVELKGATLPTASGASASNLIVIDIGLPDGTTNALPTFYIPAVTTSGPNTDNFGTSGQEYAYLRLRVNKGANLVILADNTAYAGNGAGNGTTNGYFANGCVEVMAGGKLRDGAYEGFPLGANAVILNRAGSYLSVGPEPDDTYATGNYLTTYEAYYKGYLIGPDGDPRIVWDSGNTGYLEVRPGELAISGNVTVKKLLGLIYSAYFIGNTTVTIDTTGDLFPNGDSYKFYGTDTYAKIVVKPNGKIDKGFFTSGATDVGTKLTAQTGSVTIQNTGTGGANGTYTSSISGTQNWADLADLTEAQ